MSILGIIKSILSVFKGTTFDKLKDNGFWSAQQFYWQSIFYYCYHCIRFRSLTFFSALNPAISLGGMLDDTKTEIYALLPQKIVPQTIVYNNGDDLDAILASGLSFPLICKPDIGYKGYNVVKLEDQNALALFLEAQNSQADWLIQEYVDFEREYSLLYYHLPLSNKTGITSFIEKTYPFVTGDGSSTLRQLLSQYKNAYLKREWVEKKWKDQLDSIPSRGSKFILDYIGNYSRGAKFYSRMSLIDHRLLDMADEQFKEIEGMYFFRADIKVNDIEDLREGKFKVLEINGAKSEPLHLYDPKYGFWGRWKIIKNHWTILVAIVKEVKEKESFIFPSKKDGFNALASIKEKVK